MDNNTAIITVCITGLVTLLAAIIAGTLTFFSNKLARKNDHKLAVLKVLLEAAYKEYEFRTKQDLEEAKAAGETARIKSFIEYIIFYKEIANIFSNETVSENDLINSLKKNKVLIDAYYTNREEQRPEYHKQSR
ncbi:MAG: hypothetical protein ABI594_07065 [Ginsengibacter sp.]